eukprot:762739-Hanusia_phi.AAC.3
MAMYHRGDHRNLSNRGGPTFTTIGVGWWDNMDRSGTIGVLKGNRRGTRKISVQIGTQGSDSEPRWVEGTEGGVISGR